MGDEIAHQIGIIDADSIERVIAFGCSDPTLANQSTRRAFFRLEMPVNDGWTDGDLVDLRRDDSGLELGVGPSGGLLMSDEERPQEKYRRKRQQEVADEYSNFLSVAVHVRKAKAWIADPARR
jgi:hypothetical protein